MRWPFAFLVLSLWVLSCKEDLPQRSDRGPRIPRATPDLGVHYDSGYASRDTTGWVVDDAGAVDSGLGPGDDAMEICMVFFDALCRHQQRCRTLLAGGVTIQLSLDELCHPEGIRLNLCADLVPSIEAGRIEVDFRALSVCLAEAQGGLCRPKLDSIDGVGAVILELLPTPRGACESVLVPRQGEGDICYSALECESYRCPRTCPGICERPGIQGDRCALQEECDGGHYCAENGVCAPLASQGRACSPAQYATGCRDGLYCDNNRLCQTRRPAGAACTGGIWRECEPDLACRNGVCGTMGLSPGIPCDGSNLCMVNLVCSDGYCQPGQKAWMPCGARADGPRLRCTIGTTCLPNQEQELVCIPLVRAGDSCERGEICPEGYVCSSGHCTPAALEDETCNATIPCYRGVCTQGVCGVVQLGDVCSGPGAPTSEADVLTDPCGRDAVCQAAVCQPLPFACMPP